MKKQTSLAKKQYQELDEVYGLNKTVLDKKYENFKKFNITDDEFNELSDDTKYKHLQKFLKKKTNKLRRFNLQQLVQKKRKAIINDAASKSFNQEMRKLDDEYN